MLRRADPRFVRELVSVLPADTPSGPAGSVKLASFTLGDQRYAAIEAGPLIRSITAFP